VREAIAELAYRPDALARGMRTGRSRAVGFVVSDISNPLFGAIAAGADRVLQEHGYSLVLAVSANDPDREAEALALLAQRRVDGLILSVADERRTSLPQHAAHFQATVLLDRRVQGVQADTVRSNHTLGMYEAVDRLCALGHRRIALLAGSRGQLPSRERVRAFRRRYRTVVGADPDDALIRTGEMSRDSGYLGTREILAAQHRPSALIAGNNQLFVGALGAIKDLGLSIPGDVSLVACDDSDAARLADPPIDIIDRDPSQMGEIAADLILGRIADAAASPRSMQLPTRFVQRGSVARVGKAGRAYER
jgi:LacI family transcriptional regulator